INAGFHGLIPSEIAAIDPLGIGPSRAASQYFKQFPSPNGPGRDGLNFMDYRFAAPITNSFNTTIARADYRMTPQQSIFGRLNFQDDTQNGTPQYPGQPPRSKTLTNNSGFAIGHDYAINSNWVNSFRYGMTRIDSESAGLINANYVTF